MTAGEKRELSRLGERGEGGLRKHFEKCVGNRVLLPFPPQEEEEEREQVTGVSAWCCKGFVSFQRCLKEFRILR